MNALKSHIRIDSAVVCIYFISLEISKRKCDYPYNLRYVMLLLTLLLTLRYLSVIIFTVLKKTYLNNTTFMINVNKILSTITLMFTSTSLLNQITESSYPILSILVSIIFSLVLSKILFDDTVLDLDKDMVQKSIDLTYKIHKMRELNENYTNNNLIKLHATDTSSAYLKVIDGTSYISMYMNDSLDNEEIKYYPSFTYKGRLSKMISGIIDEYLKMKHIVGRINTKNNLVITGYRLGGALARLLSIDLIDQSKIDPYKLYCITFGTPAFGDGKYSNHKKETIINDLNIIAGEDPYAFKNDHRLNHGSDSINLGYRTGVFDFIIVSDYKGKIKNYVNAIDRYSQSYEVDCWKRYVLSVIIFVIIYVINLRFSEKCF